MKKWWVHGQQMEEQDFIKWSLANKLEVVLEEKKLTKNSDDGEGFTTENLQFFDEICNSHKDSIGGKGVGRLSFLKFANSVDVESQLHSERIKFKYTPDFTLDLKRLCFIDQDK